MINFVKIRWRPKWDKPYLERLNAIMNNPDLSWAAKGLGVHLLDHKDGVRFPNCIWDGTMDALQELADHGYVNVIGIEDGKT